MSITIICDHCGWEKDDDNLPEYYGKPCPECGEGPIINDKDLAVYAAIEVLKAHGIAKDADELDPDEEGGTWVNAVATTRPGESGVFVVDEKIVDFES